MLYYTTLELISEHQDRCGILGECTIVQETFLNQVRLTRERAESILKFLDGELEYEIDGIKITLRCPKFYEFVDEYTKRRIPKQSRGDRRKGDPNSNGQIRIGSYKEGKK
jgi:hypothetical protein